MIIILGSLTTCDPGNIHTTIRDVEKDRCAPCMLLLVRLVN